MKGRTGGESIRQAIADDSNLRPLTVCNSVIVFIDVIQSTDVSVFSEAKAYYELIRRYQRLAIASMLDNHLLVERKDRGDATSADGVYARTQGDEAFLVLHGYRKDGERNNQSIVDRIYTAIRFSVDLKRRWLLEKRNLERLQQQLNPFELAVGIHCGPIALGPSARDPSHVTPEGYAINLAKRVEGESRRGSHSRIYLSQSAHQALKSWELVSEMSGGRHKAINKSIPKVLFVPGSDVELRGTISKAELFEIALFWEDEPSIIDTDNGVATISNEAARIVEPIFDVPNESRANTMDGLVERILVNPWDVPFCASLAARMALPFPRGRGKRTGMPHKESSTIKNEADSIQARYIPKHLQRRYERLKPKLEIATAQRLEEELGFKYSEWTNAIEAATKYQ